MKVKLEALKQTQAFYIWELKKESLTEKERASYLLALGSIEKIIKEEKGISRGKRTDKYIDKFGGYQKRLNY